MPNPLLRVGAPNRSKRPPERPEPIAPVPEHYAGEVFPYRGTEDHGIPVHGLQFEDVPGHDGTVPAFFEVEPEPEHVVPVRIVHEAGAKERRTARIHQSSVRIGDAQPVAIMMRNEDRISARVRLITANALDNAYFGGTSEQATPQQGYLHPGTTVTEFTTNSQDALFVNVPFNGGSIVGTVVAVYVYEEVSVVV